MHSLRGLSAAVIIGLVTATVATAAFAAHDADRDASEERTDEASRARADLAGQLRLSLDGLSSVSGLFRSSRAVTRGEFETFSSGLLTDSPLTGTLLADAAVPEPGGAAYRITAERWRAGYSRGQELDLAGNREWARALRAAVAQGRPRATPPTSLPVSGARGFLVFQPVEGSRRGSGASDTQVAVGAYDGRTLGDSLVRARRRGTRLRIRDRDQRIYGPAGDLEDAITQRVRSAGRTLTLEVATPVRASFALPATILGGGMLLTGLASVLLLGYGRREEYAAEMGERLLAEREQAQGALREAEERFSRAFSDAAAGMAIVGLDGRLLAVNAALCSGAGLTEEELLSTRWDDLAHPDELPEHRDRLQALNKDGIGVYTAERRYLHPDGRTRWLRETASLVRDSSGVPQSLIAQVVDVTESKDTAEALRASEQRYRTLVNNLPQTSVVTYDRDLRLTLAAGPALMESGMESRHVEGHSLAELSAAADFERLEPIFRAAFGGERNSLEYVDESGRGLWLRTLPLRDGSGEVTGAMAVSLDVTDRLRAGEAQRSAEARFLRAFQDSGVGMALYGIELGAEKLLDANDALCELTGYAREELLQRGLGSLNHPDDAPAAEAAVRRLMDGEENTVQTEQRVVDREGRPVWVLLNTSLVRDDAGSPTHRIVQLQDVSEHKRFERQLQHLADHDALSGLFNRRRFEEELNRELATAARYGRGGAVLAIDLDHFKFVNDSLGHSAGDELITLVGGLLTERLRESDVVARLSGDEFAILLPQADRARALAVADELLETIRLGAVVSGGPVPTATTASVGIALFGDDAEDVNAEELLAEADMAMYEAKEGGRDRRAVYAAAGRQARIAARRTWVDRIGSALAEDRFTLEGQRIMSLTGDPRPRYELLLRMVGEDGDLIPPGAFLDAAERFDLIGDIDRWVLCRATDLLAEFEAAGTKASLEVNLSATSINDAELAGVVAAELARTGVDPSGLVLETTENAAIVNVERARRFAAQVKALGCEFALDDFGAGFASFYFLKHLDFDYLKIDGEFIHNLTEDPTNRLLVRALVDIARGLGKRTIAEYVGDDETLELLRRLGADYVQGFHLGRPGPIDTSKTTRSGAAAQ